MPQHEEHQREKYAEREHKDKDERLVVCGHAPTRGDERQQACECGVSTAHGRVYDKEAKVSVVVEPDAVVDPWTVVVHLHDAAPANGAVVRTRRLARLAPFACPPAFAIVLKVDALLKVVR